MMLFKYQNEYILTDISFSDILL